MYGGKGYGKNLNMRKIKIKSCVKIKYGIHTGLPVGEGSKVGLLHRF